MTLDSLGWSPTLEQAFAPRALEGLLPARIALAHKHAFEVLSPVGSFTAGCTGRFLHLATRQYDLPTVGDWVAVKPRQARPDGPIEGGEIHALLPRTSCLSRRTAGSQEAEQLLAANIDTLFLVSGLDENFNPRRIERYLAVARSSGAEPVVILNKADLRPDLPQVLESISSLAAGVPIVALSAARGEGIQALDVWLRPGRTVALVGSSGVGKSTMINQLAGAEKQEVGAVSEAVKKGRHTTTHRELIPLASGALVIDTPGLRELQFWDVDESAVEDTFADIAALARRCRFHDCSHGAEPGCQVIAALEAGELEEARWQSYAKLLREQAYAARRASPRLAREERGRWKKINQDMRLRQKFERELE